MYGNGSTDLNIQGENPTEGLFKSTENLRMYNVLFVGEIWFGY